MYEARRVNSIDDNNKEVAYTSMFILDLYIFYYNDIREFWCSVFLLN